MKMCRIFLMLFLVIVSLSSILSMPATVWSATFNVSSVTQFQNALTTAQQNGQDDTIIVAAGTYDVSGGMLTYVAKSTVPEENFALTIEGAGTGQTIIDGGNAAQCLSILTYGLGFDDSAATFTIRSITFQNGTADYGGGAYIKTNHGSITVENSAFDNNYATYSGGGLNAFSWDSGTIMISGIIASNNVSGHEGAGACATSINRDSSPSDITVKDSIFRNNTLTGASPGGGLFAYAARGGTVTVTGCTFTGNEAIMSTDANAGGSYTETWTSGSTIFVNNTLNGNSSEYCGGAYFNGGPMIVANNTLSGNHALTNGGGMFFEMQGGTAYISNNIVWGNTAVVSGADIEIGDGNPSHIAVLSNNDYGELTSHGGGLVTEDVTNINLDPLFSADSDPDPSNWDLHLTENSPCIDAGDNTLIPSGITADSDGDSRVIDGNEDGTVTVDMGSDEYNPPPETGDNENNLRPKAGGGLCFIATAAYGSPLHPYVETLRDFRDRYLVSNKLGRKFIDLYYKYSPSVASFIARHKPLKIAVRIYLLPVIVFCYSMLHLGPAATLFIFMLIAISPTFIILYSKRR